MYQRMLRAGEAIQNAFGLDAFFLFKREKKN